MGCGSAMRLSWGLVGGVSRRRRGDAKNMFLVGYVYYFKDIRRGHYCLIMSYRLRRP